MSPGRRVLAPAPERFSASRHYCAGACRWAPIRCKGRADLPLLRDGQIVIGFGEPLTAAEEMAELARAGVSVFAMELMPRITRAQSMDALSSMATIAGYRAVFGWRPKALPKIFPMLMTAAGTITAARVLILGAGVAGLQAIATARGWARWFPLTMCAAP